jgi:hypothetical protein
MFSRKEEDTHKNEMIAKRDFLIVQNDVRIEIKEGDDLSVMNIPAEYMENLKTEGVI